MNQIERWRVQARQAERRLNEAERRVVDIAKRWARLEAEVEVVERAAARKGRS